MSQKPTLSQKPTSTNELSPRLYDLSLDALAADPNNARLHDDRNIETITSALQEVGAARSIVIDDEGVILAGNATALAAQKAGLTRVQVVEADGDVLIAVRRRGLSPEQKARLALFDNRANDLSSFDPLVLAGLQSEGVSLDGLWNGDELDALLADLPDGGLDGMPPGLTHTGGGGVVSEAGIGNDRRNTESMAGKTDESDVQRREVSPGIPRGESPAPGADAATGTEAAPPVPGLDRVTPDGETSRPGLFLHFRALKIPLSAEEGAALDTRLAAYRESAGTFYGFLGTLLGGTERGGTERGGTERGGTHAAV